MQPNGQAVQAPREYLQDVVPPPARGAQVALGSALQGDRRHPRGRHGARQDHAGLSHSASDFSNSYHITICILVFV